MVEELLLFGGVVFFCLLALLGVVFLLAVLCFLFLSCFGPLQDLGLCLATSDRPAAGMTVAMASVYFAVSV